MACCASCTAHQPALILKRHATGILLLFVLIQRARGRCLHEIQAVASLPAHPNVIGQYRAWQQRGHLFIQMDLAEHGSLGSLIRQVGRHATHAWLRSMG